MEKISSKNVKNVLPRKERTVTSKPDNKEEHLLPRNDKRELFFLDNKLIYLKSKI
jgi:hypothetical protein